MKRIILTIAATAAISTGCNPYDLTDGLLIPTVPIDNVDPVEDCIPNRDGRPNLDGTTGTTRWTIVSCQP